MRWHRQKSDTAKTDLEKTEAQKALIKARHDLAHTHERNHEIVSEVRKAKHYREQNNFAELIRQAFGGTR